MLLAPKKRELPEAGFNAFKWYYQGHLFDPMVADRWQASRQAGSRQAGSRQAPQTLESSFSVAPKTGCT